MKQINNCSAALLSDIAEWIIEEKLETKFLIWLNRGYSSYDPGSRVGQLTVELGYIQRELEREPYGKCK